MTSMPWGAKQPPPLSGDARAHPNVGHMARPTHYQPAPVKGESGVIVSVWTMRAALLCFAFP